jgi:hypothetical protein
MVTESFPVVKLPGRGVNHPPHLKVKERVKLNIYSPLCAFAVCSRVNFTVKGCNVTYRCNGSMKVERPETKAHVFVFKWVVIGLRV